MNENFKNACKMAIGEAIIKIGNIPEFENCSIGDIKRGLAEVLKNYIENVPKYISREESCIYDSNNNILAFTNDDSKDNDHKYICALIPNSCFKTFKNFRPTMRLIYLLNEQDFLSSNSVSEYTIEDKILNYFTSNSLIEATLFEDSEVYNIHDLLLNNRDYKNMYTILKIDSTLYPKESVLNKKYVLYYFNNGTINEVEDMYFYIKDFITNIDIGIFYDELKNDGSFKTTKNKKEAVPISFENALLLLVALRKLDPEIEWHMEEY